MITVFSLSSLFLGMMVLAIERALKSLLQITKGQRKAAQFDLSPKKAWICLPNRFGFLRMNHGVRHRECSSVLVPKLDRTLFGS